MLRGLISQLVDEVAANILLHRFLRHRHTLPCAGPGPDRLPGLYSGELHEFYAPAPTPLDLMADRDQVDRNAERTVWDCRFTSDTTSAWPENNRVWCRHWQTHAGDRGLTVVGVDGIVSLGTGWFRRLAQELNPQGIDVIVVDAPCNFRRTPAGYKPGQLVAAGDLAHQLALTRQAVLDVWRVIESVQKQGRRVGLVGVSYGGWLTLLTALVAAELDFLIALVPPVDIVRMLREPTTIVRGIRRGLGFGPLERAELERLSRPIIPSLWQPRLPANRILLHAARYDRLVPRAGIERLAREWETDLTIHDDAHFRLALGVPIIGIVARQVLALCDGNV
ncbi:MAG: alpha/beta fold hydrolase [Planctomycetaceae bacterium]|nr:alpha/beta fold hydrolase [Planctomycetaceae bacterium]